jgi:hypothetical protein
MPRIKDAFAQYDPGPSPADAALKGAQIGIQLYQQVEGLEKQRMQQDQLELKRDMARFNMLRNMSKVAIRTPQNLRKKAAKQYHQMMTKSGSTMGLEAVESVFLNEDLAKNANSVMASIYDQFIETGDPAGPRAAITDADKAQTMFDLEDGIEKYLAMGIKQKQASASQALAASKQQEARAERERKAGVDETKLVQTAAKNISSEFEKRVTKREIEGAMSLRKAAGLFGEIQAEFDKGTPPENLRAAINNLQILIARSVQSGVLTDQDFTRGGGEDTATAWLDSWKSFITSDKPMVRYNNLKADLRIALKNSDKRNSNRNQELQEIFETQTFGMSEEAKERLASSAQFRDITDPFFTPDLEKVLGEKGEKTNVLTIGGDAIEKFRGQIQKLRDGNISEATIKKIMQKRIKTQFKRDLDEQLTKELGLMKIEDPSQVETVGN